MNKRGLSIGGIILVILFIIFIAIASYFIYSLYNDYYSPAKSFNVNYTQLESQPSYLNSEIQYFPNMRFNHNNLSYFIDSSCPIERLDNIKEAFSIIKNRTEIISFYESGLESDINVACSEESLEEEENTFIAGSGGAEGEVPFSGIYYILPKGNVTLYKDINCQSPIVEIHEILHVLGFNHSFSETSIMYPIASCNQALTNDIIAELKRLYLIPALPDLYFSNITGSKRGRYVNLNFSIRNQGLKESGDIIIILYGNNKDINKFNLQSIEPGNGIAYSIQNIRTPYNLLKLVIQNGKELDENNNMAELSLD